jgi:hypothetical protein
MPQNEAVLSGSDMNLEQQLSSGRFEIAHVASYLDGLDATARLAAVRSLGRRAQANLFEAVRGVKKLTLEDMVPARIKPLEEVPHNGKNSLAMFTLFAKVFTRPSEGAKELWGYNRSGGFVETFVGPGYYVAYEQNGEIMVDYTRLPEGKLDSWPRILSNHSRASRFVYADMIDALRGVSKHVTIGRAIRNGKEADNWFLLCRSVD